MLRNDKPPDDTEPSPERQAELEALYQTNVEADNAPYQDAHIQTRGELHWIMQRRGWTDKFSMGSDRDPDVVTANFSGANLSNANLSNVILQGADLSGADLSNANLSHADLWFASLDRAYIWNASLKGAQLVETDLSDALIEGTDLSRAVLGDTDLRGASLVNCHMDVKTILEGIKIDKETAFSDIVWNGVPLTLVDWQQAPVIGDETETHNVADSLGKKKSTFGRLHDYLGAARAYRQLAVALRSQGLNEDADHYAYRGHLMQRASLRYQAFERSKGRPVSLWYRLRKLTAYVWSCVLWGLAGYGYRPGFSVLAYVLIVGAFAVAYHSFDVPTAHAAYHLSWLESFVISLTAFHGRGFFAQQYSPGDPQSVLAAGEAIIGLLIEITFIATFTQRFFAR